jgi:hypothetical protein
MVSIWLLLHILAMQQASIISNTRLMVQPPIAEEVLLDSRDKEYFSKTSKKGFPENGKPFLLHHDLSTAQEAGRFRQLCLLLSHARTSHLL